MNTFIVIFSTDNDAQYNTVTSVLKGFNGWARITDTVWALGLVVEKMRYGT